MVSNRLVEVDIIRPLIIFLLLLLHSVTIFEGGWGVECEEVPLYSWLFKFIVGFRIETIALIAGYVFAYQSIVLSRQYSFKNFIIKKAKRLLVPMILFGIIYYFIFYYNPSTFNVGDFIVSLLSGCGHLWFLPMLFWCFLGIWIIDKYKLVNKWIFLGLAIFSILPIYVLIPVKLQFGLSRLPHFLFYVYLGYVLFKYKDKILDKLGNTFSISFLWVIYVLIVILINWINPFFTFKEYSFLENLGFSSLLNSIKLLQSCAGILALYLLVCVIIKRTDYVESKFTLNASKLCYGVYVYHQFILYYLYTIYDLPHRINIYAVPWVGLAITLVGSLILTILTLKTRLGRNLIG